MEKSQFDVDVAVIGGGINGAAIARDAVGRGHSVWLAEAQDYAQGTSSRSSKLIHGGIRYLEQFEFKLVRESLHERETLMKIAPHLVFPMRFLIPIRTDQKRPAFIVWLGLVLYDLLSGRKLLARTGRLSAEDRRAVPHLRQDSLRSVLHYPDCWTDDARLTLETLLDARMRGANIANRRNVTAIKPLSSGFEVEYTQDDQVHAITAQYVVNAAGPWALDVLNRTESVSTKRRLRLVRGSHIIVLMPNKKDDRSFLLQNPDGRVVFVIPWLDNRYRILGTTDEPHEGAPDNPECSTEEMDYIINTYNRYFDNRISTESVLATYAGVRPLVDDGSDNPSKVTREYELDVHPAGDGAMVTIFGGKLTTHRTLGELVLSKLEGLGLPPAPKWTATEPLHGGLLSRPALARLVDNGPAIVPVQIRKRWAFTYGSQTQRLFDRVTDNPALAEDIVPGVPLVELLHARDEEDARTGDDFLTRRTKLYMDLDQADQDLIADWFQRTIAE